MLGRVVVAALLCNFAFVSAEITEADLDACRETWGNGLISVSTAYDAEGIESATAIASDMLDKAYGFNLGPVLFKPTLASGEKTFRPTKEGALSYFVGHNNEYPLDGGFALKSWRKVGWISSKSFIKGDVAMWMGWLLCTDEKNKTTKVDKSFGYKKDKDGVIRIVQHHSSLPYVPPPPAPITEADLDAARKAWEDGLVAISTAYDEEGIDSAKAIASDILDNAYGYDYGPVLFKPTLASGEYTFRPTKVGALSYFVGHNPDFPLDGGFALKSWRKVDWITSASFVEGDLAMWMGWLLCTDSKNVTTQVDKSFGYERDAQGVLRIVLHHSSLPYKPSR